MFAFAAIMTLLSLCQPTYAQRRFVVIDMETRVPQRDVTVTWDHDREAKTIWDGSFMIDKAEGNIVLRKPGYMTRTMAPEELTDTIALLPTFNKLTEVVIYGKDKTPKISWSLKPLSKEDIAAMGAKNPGVDVDIMGSIEKLLTIKKRKKQKKVRKILEDYTM